MQPTALPDKNIFHAILSRRSSRTFNGLHLDADILSMLNDLCRTFSTAPIAGEPVTFRHVRRPSIVLLRNYKASGMLGTYGVIKGACSYLAMSAGTSPAEQMLAGYLFERIILQCTMMNVDTCWLGGTFGKSGFQAEVDRITTETSQPAFPVTIVSPLGHRTPKTRFAERMMRRIISSDNREPFGKLFDGVAAPDEHLMEQIADARVEAASLTIDEKLSIALECVRLAPSSTNSQPWRATVNRNLKGRPTGIAFSCVTSGKFSSYDMGIAYCHFAEACHALGISGTFQPGENPCEQFFALQG